MNAKMFRHVFSKRLGCLVAVGEVAHGCGKSGARGSGTMPLAHVSNTLAISLAVALAFGGEAMAQTLPTGGNVVGGSGGISQSGSTMTVQQGSNRMAIDWQTFNIGAGNSVVFNQPSASAVALNRVMGGSRSEIYGNLSANGSVFLLNPNGVLFGRTAEVNVGGLFASTRNLSVDDFMAGNYRFSGNEAGEVINQGRLKAADGGYIVLAGQRVLNEGTISASGGTAALAVGETITLKLDGEGKVGVAVDGATVNALVSNSGLIEADGGQVLLTSRGRDMLQASVMNLSGVVRARSIAERNGIIVIDGGTPAAGNADTGNVTLQNATLDVSGLSAGERGGRVEVTGRNVSLLGNTTVDARGEAGGGTVLVGGDWQGGGTLTHAETVVMDTAARIDASALTSGAGGKVVLWSDQRTDFHGDIIARGKGTVEVSGKNALRFTGSVDTGGGTLLLDPLNITVQNAVGDGVNTFSGSQIATLLGASNVVLNADNDITWNATAALDYNGIGSTGRTLTLEAGNNIAYSGTISDSVAGGDRLNVVFNADRDVSSVGGINIASGASIRTSGGDIVLRGGNAALAPLPSLTDAGYAAALGATAARSISIAAATLNAEGGNITMRGIGIGGGNSPGIAIAGSTVQTNGTGAITLDGIGGSGATFNAGVRTTLAANVSTADGALTIQGTGGGTGVENAGVRHNGGTIQTTGTGNLTINAQGSTSTNYNDGAVIDSGILRVNNGNLTITGTGRGTGIGSDGIELANSAMVEATGAGNVTFNGTSIATGANTNRGVTVWLSSTVRTATGALTLQGTSANAANGAAISVEAGGTVGGAGQSGAITLTGDSMNFSASTIRGSGSMLLQPLTPSATIGLGNGAVGSLNLTAAEILQLQNGFSSITIGRSDSSGAVDVRTAAFLDPVTIRTPAGSGSISVGGALSTGAGASSGDITLQAAGNIGLATGTISTANALSITGASYSVTGSSGLTSNTLAFGNTNGISNTGTLALTQTSDTTIANSIGGAGGNLTKAGTNTLTLTGANTYTGTTTISAGTLQVGAGGTTGTLGTGVVVNNGALVFNRSDDTTANTISGSGSVRKEGAGTVTLTGNNTYSGATTINAGTLKLQSGNASPNYSIASGAVLELNVASGTRSMSSATFNGAGTLRKTGAGVVNWGAASGTFALSSGALIDVLEGTFIGGSGANEVWTNNLADLNVASGAVFTGVEANVRVDALTGAGTISTGLVCCGYTGMVFGVDNGSGHFSGVLSNSAAAGNFTKVGSGTQILSGNNTYTGTTTISAGTLQVGVNGASGTLGTGAVTSNANLVFNRSDTVAMSTLAAGGITGTGNVTALIGGGLDVNRSIALTGAGSTIHLQAGKDVAAGTTTGGDVTLTNGISTSGTGTVTIFSGNATTAAYEGKISGATGATRLETLNSNASGTATAVAGRRNYYYREAPALIAAPAAVAIAATPAALATALNVVQNPGDSGDALLSASEVSQATANTDATADESRVDVTQSPQSVPLARVAARDQLPQSVSCVDGGIRLPGGVSVPDGVSSGGGCKPAGGR